MFQYPNDRGARTRRGRARNLIEKIMKENFPNLAKEIHIPVKEAQRVPNNWDQKRSTPKHHN